MAKKISFKTKKNGGIDEIIIKFALIAVAMIVAAVAILGMGNFGASLKKIIEFF